MGPNLVPPERRHEQHVTGPQLTLHPPGLGEPRESREVGIFYVDGRHDHGGALQEAVAVEVSCVWGVSQDGLGDVGLVEVLVVVGVK